MTTLGDVGHFFKALGGKVHDLLVKIFGQPALDNVENQVKQILTQDTLVIFQDAIAAVETLTVGGQPASGDQKRAAAFEKIAADLKAQGKSLGTSVINLGIELVLGLLKAKAPAAPASTPQS